MELYIGVPNGIILCIDAVKNSMMSGRIYHGYQKQPLYFESLEQMVRYAEEFFDEIGFPVADTNSRSFLERHRAYRKANRKQRILSDIELMQRRGKLGSFILRVQHRQYSSWQGTVTWIEQGQTRTFHSALELFKLLETALRKRT